MYIAFFIFSHSCNVAFHYIIAYGIYTHDASGGRIISFNLSYKRKIDRACCN